VEQIKSACDFSIRGLYQLMLAGNNDINREVGLDEVKRFFTVNGRMVKDERIQRLIREEWGNGFEGFA
jgi:hypothetical protein